MSIQYFQNPSGRETYHVIGYVVEDLYVQSKGPFVISKCNAIRDNIPKSSIVSARELPDEDKLCNSCEMMT